MEIRPCTAEDLDALRCRWPTTGEVHEVHYARDREGRATYLVAWDDTEPLGSCMVQWGDWLGRSARAAFPDAVGINHLHVRAESRGQGVGTRLMQAAEALVVGRGHNQVVVAVGDSNGDAERLYVRLGYARTGITEVSEYDWVDEAGAVRHAVERNHILVKEAGDATLGPAG